MSNLPYSQQNEPQLFRAAQNSYNAVSGIRGQAVLGIGDIALRNFESRRGGNVAKTINTNSLTKYQNELEKINKTLSTSQSLVNKSFGAKINTKELQGFGSIVEKTSKHLQDLPKAWQASDNAIGKFRKSLSAVETGMEKLAGIKLTSDIFNILTTSLKQVKDEINNVSSSLKIMGKSGLNPDMIRQLEDFRGSLLSLDTSGIEDMATGFVAQYKEITRGMSAIGTLSSTEIKKAAKEGKDYLSDYFDTLQKMVNGSLKNTVTSSEAISASYSARQAGIGAKADGSFNEDAINKAVENTLKLTATQGGDANQVMELLTQTMTAFGMSANSSGEILGKLNELVNVGITTIPELASGFGQLGVTASTAGVTLDEMTGSLAAMTQSGSNTFSSMTNLQNLYNKITQGSITERLAEMNATIDGQAVRFDAASVASMGFANNLEQVNQALGGSAEKWQAILGGDQEATKAVFGTMKQGVDELKDVIEQISKAGVSSLEDAFNIKIDNDEILKFEQALNRASEIALKLGKLLTPLFSKGLDRIEKNIDTIGNLVDNYGNLILTIVELSLQLKVVNGLFGILIGTIMKLAGAYVTYLTLSGKLIQNGIKLFGMLTNQNKAIQNNNVLWDKNVSMFQKVLGVFGQLLGFYDLEKGSKSALTKEQEKEIAKHAEARAIKAAAHKEVMAQLEEQKNMYDEVNNARVGKGEGSQGLFVNAKKAEDELEEIRTRRGDINNAIQSSDESLGLINERRQQLQNQNAPKEEIDALDNLEKRIKKERSDLVDRGYGEDFEISRREKLMAEAKLKEGQYRRGELSGKDKRDAEIGLTARYYNSDDERRQREVRSTLDAVEKGKNSKSFQNRVAREKNNGIAEIGGSAAGVLVGAGFISEGSIQTIESAKNLWDKLTEGVGKTGKPIQMLLSGLKNLTMGIFQTGAKIVQTVGLFRTAALGVLGVLAAGLIAQHKKAQEAKDMLTEAGIDNSEIVSVWDAVVIGFKSGLETIGKYVNDFVNSLISTIVNGTYGIARDLMKAAIEVKYAFLGSTSDIINFIIDSAKQFKIPGTGNWEKIELSELNKNKESEIGEIDKNYKQIINKTISDLKKPFDDVGKTISDLNYALMGANFDIAWAKLAETSDKLNSEATTLLKSTENLADVNKGAAFGNVTLDLIRDGKLTQETTNLNSELSRFLSNVNNTQEGLSNLSNVIDATKANITTALQEAEERINRIDKIAEVQTKAAAENSGVSKGQQELLIGYINARSDAEANGRIYEPTNEEKEIIQQATGMSTQSQDELLKLQQQKAEVEELKTRRAKGLVLTAEEENKVRAFGAEQEKRIAALKKEQSMNSGKIIEKAIDENKKGAKQNEILNARIKTVKDLSGAFESIKAFGKNLVDIGGSGNPEGSRAINSGKNLQSDLAGKVGNFARTMKTVAGGKYTAEQLIELQKNNPEQYKELVKKSGVNFQQAGTVFSDIQKLFPQITQSLIDNANMGYTNKTNTAEQFKNMIGGKVTEQFKNAGFSDAESKKYTEALLAEQKIQEQIMALEQNDHEVRLQRYEIQRSVYESLKNNELTVSTNTIEKIHDIEKKSIEDSLNFEKNKLKRLLDLNKAAPGTIDPGAIQEAENKVANITNQMLDKRIQQINELTSVRLSNIEKEKNAIEALANYEYTTTKDLILKKQNLENKQLGEKLKNAQLKLSELKGSGKANSENIANAENEITSIRNQIIIKRIRDEEELIKYETERITAAYETQYAKIQENLIRGGKGISDKDRIEMEVKYNEEMIAINVKSLEKLKKILEQNGQSTLFIEQKIQQERLKLLQTYVDTAKKKYDELISKIEINANKTITKEEKISKALQYRISMMDKISALNEQVQSLGGLVENNLDKEFDNYRAMIEKQYEKPAPKPKTKEEIEEAEKLRKLNNIELEFWRRKDTALKQQLTLEKESLALKRQQLDLQFQLLESEQKRNEIHSKANLEKTIIEEQKVLANPSQYSEKEIADATTNRQVAEIDYRATRLGRNLMEVDKTIRARQQQIDEWSQEQSAKERTREVGTNIDRLANPGKIEIIKDLIHTGWNPAFQRQKGINYDDAPNLVSQSGSGVSDDAIDKEIAAIQEQAARLTKPIADELGKKINELTPIKNDTASIKSLLEDINAILKNIRDGSSTQNGNKETKDNKETKVNKETMAKQIIDKTIQNMMNMSGENIKNKPNFVFDSTLLQPGSGGNYDFNTNIMTLPSDFQEKLIKGDEEAKSVLTHELRHWMQDEGTMKNGWLNTNVLKEDWQKKYAKEGLEFSGNNKLEQDAYTYDAMYRDKVVPKINTFQTKASSLNPSSTVNKNYESLAQNNLNMSSKPQVLNDVLLKIYDAVSNISKNNKTSATVNNNDNKKVDLKIAPTINVNMTGGGTKKDGENIANIINNQIYTLFERVSQEI